MSKKYKGFNPDKRNFACGLSNNDRANNAAIGVEATTKARGEVFTGEEGDVQNLLTDLGHLCDRNGYDFVQLINDAKRDWRSER